MRRSNSRTSRMSKRVEQAPLIVTASQTGPVGQAGLTETVIRLDRIEGFLRRYHCAEESCKARAVAPCGVRTVHAFVVPPVTFLATPRVGAGTRVGILTRPERMVRRWRGRAGHGPPFVIKGAAANGVRVDKRVRRR